MCQHNTGVCYKDGQGCEQSYERAAEWFEKAARQGYADAQVNLGVLYCDGQGVFQSFERAVELYKQSAAQGNVIAQHNLAACYANGQGVTQDYQEARRLFALALKRGNTAATEDLKRIDEKIRGEIIRKLSPLVGKRVVITGTSREDLNGRVGQALSFDGAKGRYVVRLEAEGGGEGPTLKVKPGNLKLAA